MSDSKKWDHEVALEEAHKFLDWIRNRGGVANWKSANLGNPSASWSTPFLEVDGTPKRKPTWEAEDVPSAVHKDATRIGVYSTTLVETIPAKVLRRGMSLVLSRGTEKKLNAALKRVEKSHGNSFYRKGGMLIPEIYIYASKDIGSLQEWADAQDPVEQETA